MTTTREREAEIRDEGYQAGSTMAWRSVLQRALGELHAHEGEVPELGTVVLRLEEATAALRRLFVDLNLPWPEGRNLADVVDKYLNPHLEELLGDEVPAPVVVRAPTPEETAYLLAHPERPFPGPTELAAYLGHKARDTGGQG